MAASFGAYWARRLLTAPLTAFPKSPVYGWFAGYLVCFALSAAFSEIPARNFLETYKLSCAVLAFVICIVLFRQRKELRMLASAVALAGGALALIGLLQYLGALPKSWWDRQDFLSSVYMNHNHFAGFLELALPVSLGALLADRDAGKKTLLLFLCGIMGVAFFLTMSRGGYLAMAAGLTVFTVLLLVRKSGGRLWWMLALIALCGVSLSFFGTGAITQRLRSAHVSELAADLSWQDRLYVWRTAIKSIVDHPWVGTGPGTFGYVFLRYHAEAFRFRPVYAHNDLINLIADCGLPAAIAVLGMLTVLLRKVLKGLISDESNTRFMLGAGGLGAVFAFLVHALGDFNFHIPANFLLFAVVLGMLSSIHTAKVYSSRAAAIFWNMVVSFLILAVAAGSLVFGLSHYYLLNGAPTASLSLDSRSAAAYADRAKQRMAVDPMAAARDLQRARELNPLEPNYDLWYVECYRLGTYRGRAAELIPAYERMLSKEPANAVLHYLAASRLLEINTPPDAAVEKWALEHLRASVRLDPDGQSARVLDLVWNRTRDMGRVDAFTETAGIDESQYLKFIGRHELWRFARASLTRFQGIRPNQFTLTGGSVEWENDPDDEIPLSSFRSESAGSIYKAGFFYGGGQIHTRVKVHKPLFRLVIRARSSAARGVFPYLVVRLDGRVVNAHYIDMRVNADYYSLIETEPGSRLLALEFVNDAGDERTGQDRNIWIEKVQIQYPKEG